jgi:ComF family protein
MLYVKTAVKDHFHSLVHLLFPELCIACNRKVDDIGNAFCVDCYLDFPFTRITDFCDNEFTEHFRGKVKLKYGTSLFFFVKRGLVQNMIRQLKYHRKTDYGLKLGRLYGNTFKESPIASGIDIIVPVPLHKKKLAVRGYNQSEIIADGIASVFDRPVSNNNLIRQKNTLTQTRLSNEARQENIRGAFTLKDELEFQNKHILLVDDVLTTGSTLLGCAAAFERVKGVELSMATIAMGDVV